MEKRIFLITGANGFLGNNIVRLLAAKGENVRALLLPGDTPVSLQGLACQIYFGDVTRAETLGEFFQAAEDVQLFVIHCAGIVSIGTRPHRQVKEVNVNGTKNIVQKVLETHAKLIYINTVHAIPEQPPGKVMAEVTAFDPQKVVGEYAKTKAEAANYVLQMRKTSGLNACILHPSGMIGPYDFGNSHLTQLILDYANGRLRACVKGGYDFVDVRDVAQGAILACHYGKPGQCYILSNVFLSIPELLSLIGKVGNIPRVKHILPMWLAKFTAPLAEEYYKLQHQPPLYTKYSLYTLTANGKFTNEKAKREICYTTRDMESTIRDTLAWLRCQKRIP